VRTTNSNIVDTSGSARKVREIHDSTVVEWGERDSNPRPTDSMSRLLGSSCSFSVSLVLQDKSVIFRSERYPGNLTDSGTYGRISADRLAGLGFHLSRLTSTSASVRLKWRRASSRCSCRRPMMSIHAAFIEVVSC